MLAALYQPFPMLPGRRAQAWRHQPAYRRPRHFHAEPEINLVVQGSCVLGVGDRSARLEAGELLLLAPGQDHELLEASDDLSLFVMALTPELGARVCGQRVLATESFSVPWAEAARYTEVLHGLAEARDAQAVELRLGELFEQTSARPSGAHVLSRRALEQVRSDPSISGAALASRLRSGVGAISRRFHADVGVRFVDYRARLKLMEFVRLVDAGQSFTQAALAADFGSYAQCHRVCYRWLGCSPRDYFGGERARIDQA